METFIKHHGFKLPACVVSFCQFLLDSLDERELFMRDNVNACHDEEDVCWKFIQRLQHRVKSIVFKRLSSDWSRVGIEPEL
jgi:hypothetical protein